MDVGESKTLTFIGGKDTVCFMGNMLNDALKLKKEEIVGGSILEVNRSYVITRSRVNAYTIREVGC
jgi:hypothetical protein